MVFIRSPCFFKIFFPNLSSETLGIPRAFWKHIKGGPSGTFSLKGPSGNIWHVDLIEDASGMSFQNGWREFVVNHSIVVGDFLVFRYDGNSQFTVLLFDTSACEKENAFFIKPCQDICTRKRKRWSDNHFPLQRPFQRKSTGSNKSMNQSEVNSNRSTMDPPSKEGTVVPQRQCAAKQDANTVAVRRSSNKNPINSTKTSPTKRSTKVHSDFLTLKKGSQSEKAVFKARRCALVSQRRPITEKEAERALRKAKLFKSENPTVVQVMQESYVYFGFCMHIPSQFAKEHLPKINKKVTLWDPTGRRWTVDYLAHSCRRVLSGGWRAFSYANNLELHDVCVFEVIGKENIQVHIVRVVGKLTPLIRNSTRSKQ